MVGYDRRQSYLRDYQGFLSNYKDDAYKVRTIGKSNYQKPFAIIHQMFRSAETISIREFKLLVSQERLVGGFKFDQTYGTASVLYSNSKAYIFDRKKDTVHRENLTLDQFPEVESITTARDGAYSDLLEMNDGATVFSPDEREIVLPYTAYAAPDLVGSSLAKHYALILEKRDQRLQISNSPRWQPLHYLEHDSKVTLTVRSNTGKYIATATQRGVVMLWEYNERTQTWEEQFQKNDCATNPVSIYFSHDDHFIYIGLHPTFIGGELTSLYAAAAGEGYQRFSIYTLIDEKKALIDDYVGKPSFSNPFYPLDSTLFLHHRKASNGVYSFSIQKLNPSAQLNDPTLHDLVYFRRKAANIKAQFSKNGKYITAVVEKSVQLNNIPTTAKKHLLFELGRNNKWKLLTEEGLHDPETRGTQLFSTDTRGFLHTAFSGNGNYCAVINNQCDSDYPDVLCYGPLNNDRPNQQALPSEEEIARRSNLQELPFYPYYTELPHYLLSLTERASLRVKRYIDYLAGFSLTPNTGKCYSPLTVKMNTDGCLLAETYYAAAFSGYHVLLYKRNESNEFQLITRLPNCRAIGFSADSRYLYTRDWKVSYPTEQRYRPTWGSLSMFELKPVMND